MSGMQLPVMPPVEPMLAKSVPEIPTGELSFEPKWDGFRSIVFRDGDEVEIGSRNEKPMTRYFPEVVEAVKANLPERCVVDGEIVVVVGDRLEFEVLQQRIHPAASRVKLLSEQTPASFVAFDLLALDDADYTKRPFAERRAALEQALAGAAAADPPHADHPRPRPGRSSGSPSSRAPGWTGWSPSRWPAPTSRTSGPCSRSSTSAPPTAWWPATGCTRAAPTASARCCSASTTTTASWPASASSARSRRPGARSCSPSCSRWSPTFDDHPWAWAKQEEGARTPRNSEGSRWNDGKDLSFVPLRPERVVEVRYEHMEGVRFRHTAQFNRWRPDREPRSCTYEQLEEPVKFDLAEILSITPGMSTSASVERGVPEE